MCFRTNFLHDGLRQFRVRPVRDLVVDGKKLIQNSQNHLFLLIRQLCVLNDFVELFTLKRSILDKVIYHHMDFHYHRDVLPAFQTLCSQDLLEDFVFSDICHSHQVNAICDIFLFGRQRLAIVQLAEENTNLLIGDVFVVVDNKVVVLYSVL